MRSKIGLFIASASALALFLVVVIP